MEVLRYFPSYQMGDDVGIERKIRYNGRDNSGILSFGFHCYLIKEFK